MHYTAEDIRNYLIYYHHLCDESKLTTKQQMLDFVDQVGCIQFDPLDPVGRNADLVLQARYKKYRKYDIQNYLYKDRLLFDVWDKNMAICPVDHWPYFSRFRQRHLDWCRDHQASVEQITAHLKKHPSACSSDFELEDKVDWHYGPQRLAKAALECMCYAGLAVVHHKKGTRRYYCLAENFIPAEYFHQPDPNQTEEEYWDWFVLRRINSVGLLWNRPSDAFLGIREFGGKRPGAYKRLQEKNLIQEITVDGIKNPFYIDTKNLPVLKNISENGIKTNKVKFLAPLDNLIWDRQLIEALFNFDYKWEVYVPAEKRKYGYYVLPVLWGNQFAGRVELVADKTADTLIGKNFWPEKIKNKNKFNKAFEKSLLEFAVYNRCDHIQNEITL